MSENRKKHDALACLTDWLNNGAQLLDEEIVESLSDEDYDERKTAKEAVPFAASENQVSGKKKRRLYRWKKHVNALTSGAYTDAWWYRTAAIVMCVSLIGLLLCGYGLRIGNCRCLISLSCNFICAKKHKIHYSSSVYRLINIFV